MPATWGQLFLQVQQRVSPLYLKGTELNGRMRAILVDWLVEIHARFQLLQETLYMCVAIMDRYLQVSRRRLRNIRDLGGGTRHTMALPSLGLSLRCRCWRAAEAATSVLPLQTDF